MDSLSPAGKTFERFPQFVIHSYPSIQGHYLCSKLTSNKELDQHVQAGCAPTQPTTRDVVPSGKSSTTMTPIISIYDRMCAEEEEREEEKKKSLTIVFKVVPE
jgi:hypothetical protein